jgi:TetR/AcrR family transcriptional regulator, transcriptional repressor for nem operon
MSEYTALMNTATSRKQLTHDRIVTTAAKAIRRGGFHGVGVADIMKEAGLTHGGFYAHFASRNALLTEALERAGQEGASRVAKEVETRRRQGASAFRALVDAYLSERHLGAPERMCAVAALASEIPRQSPEVRKAAAQRVRDLIAMVAHSLPADVPSAPVIACQLVGALQLSRALGDNAEGRALLTTTRNALLAQFDRPAP